MNRIKADTQQIIEMEESVRDQVRTIRDALQKMQGDVNALNSMWSGTAHDSFNAAFLKDLSDLSELCGEMREIADFEQNAHEQYRQCESNVAEVIDSIHVL